MRVGLVPELKLLLVASGSVSFETQPYNEL